ncbi:hypothetical protein [Chlamydia vaughanii]|uniref:hypothetical protein n=1 Tax=Chlamydia vaughanii TaxID=3112552 RepID=UPI0032B12650
MFLCSFPDSFAFIRGIQTHPSVIKSAYVRGLYKLNSFGGHFLMLDCNSLKSGLLSCVPILGTIRGIATLYSIWAVKDKSKDSCFNLFAHTVLGVLETLGLGIATFLVRITTTALIILGFVIALLINSGIRHIISREQNSDIAQKQ